MMDFSNVPREKLEETCRDNIYRFRIFYLTALIYIVLNSFFPEEEYGGQAVFFSGLSFLIMFGYYVFRLMPLPDHLREEETSESE